MQKLSSFGWGKKIRPRKSLMRFLHEALQLLLHCQWAVKIAMKPPLHRQHNSWKIADWRSQKKFNMLNFFHSKVQACHVTCPGVATQHFLKHFWWTMQHFQKLVLPVQAKNHSTYSCSLISTLSLISALFLIIYLLISALLWALKIK